MAWDRQSVRIDPIEIMKVVIVLTVLNCVFLLVLKLLRWLFDVLW